MTARTSTVTTTSPAPKVAGMIDARRRDSATKRTRVRVAVERMLADGEPITFAAVARHAGVSTWLVYAPGMREAIDSARIRQRAQPATQPVAGVVDANRRNDLALARAEITRLRAERDQQHQQLRLALGVRLDNLAKADLLARLDELTAANSDLSAALTQAQADNHTLSTRVTELEDDLAATRTSLRRMIRAENRPPETGMPPGRPTP